jgi:hypothetical protein
MPSGSSSRTDFCEYAMTDLNWQALVLPALAFLTTVGNVVLKVVDGRSAKAARGDYMRMIDSQVASNSEMFSEYAKVTQGMQEQIQGLIDTLTSPRGRFRGGGR